MLIILVENGNSLSDISEPVIENVIIIAFLMADTASKQYKIWWNVSYFLLYIW